MAAGGDDNVSFFFRNHSFVFFFHYRCAYGCFLNVVKAKFLQGAAHGFYTYAVVIGNELRRKADDYGVSRLNQNSYLFNAVGNFFCVLRTLYNAITAKDTLVADNVCLISRKADCFYGALSYAAKA